MKDITRLTKAVDPVYQSSSSTVQKKKSNLPGNAKDSLIQRSLADQAKSLGRGSGAVESKSKLSPAVQAKMENSFQTDFSDVTIHQGDSATQMNALAYTQGNDIHFAPGKYNPESKSGQQLLGHELTHVVQQRNNSVQPTTQLKGVGVNDDKSLEKEADEMGKLASEGKKVYVSGNGDGIQKKEGDNINSVLFDMETTGAAASTAKQDDLDITGVAASEKLAQNDFSRINPYIKYFIEIGNKYGIPPAILAAIASRESRGGAGLDEDGWAKYDPDGYGLMQIDTKYGNKNATDHDGRSKEHIDMAAKHFKKGWDDVKAKHPDWEPAWQLRGAVAAYNFGVTNVQTKGGLDKGSTGGDYSSDIWARARYYSTKKEFGVEAALISKAAESDGNWFTNGLSSAYNSTVNFGDKVINEGKELYNNTSNKISGFGHDIAEGSKNIYNSASNKVSGWGTSLKQSGSEVWDYTFGSDDNKIKPVANNQVQSNTITYIVQSGETLDKIAKKYNVTSKDLAEKNAAKLKTWGTVKGFLAGESIIIPTGGISVAVPQQTENDLYKSLAEKIYKAIDGLGTDNESVYSALTSLKNEQKSIDKLKEIYLADYKASLEADIRGDFSGDALKKVLGLINIKDGSNEEVAAPTAKSKFDKSELLESKEYLTDDLESSAFLYGKRIDYQLGETYKDATDTTNKKYKVKYGTTFQDNKGYYEALDKFYAKRNEKSETKISANQQKVLEIARKASRDSDYLNQIIQSTGKEAKIDFTNALLEYEGLKFSSVLKYRMENFHKFCYALGFYLNKTIYIGGAGAMRNRQTAHKWSVEHVIVTQQNKNEVMGNFKNMYKNDTYNVDGDIKDEDGNKWAKTSHFVDTDGTPVTEDNFNDLDSNKSFEKIKDYVNTFNYRSNKTSTASEGYLKNTAERLPNHNSMSVSPHITGDALDIDKNGFGDFRDDPIIDYIAYEFGVIRNANKEQWHFQLTGLPITDIEVNH